jgi:hypothetical protein
MFHASTEFGVKEIMALKRILLSSLPGERLRNGRFPRD